MPILRCSLPGGGTLPVVVWFVSPPSRRSSPRFFFLSKGFQLVIGSAHLLSRILLTCPVRIHFRFLTCSISTVTLVFSLTQMFVFLSQYVMVSIHLSICVCAAASLFFAWVVSAHVSAPCQLDCPNGNFEPLSSYRKYTLEPRILELCILPLLGVLGFVEYIYYVTISVQGQYQMLKIR